MEIHFNSNGFRHIGVLNVLLLNPINILLPKELYTRHTNISLSFCSLISLLYNLFFYSAIYQFYHYCIYQILFLIKFLPSSKIPIATITCLLSPVNNASLYDVSSF